MTNGKEKIREDSLRARQGLSEIHRENASKKITDKILSLSDYQNANMVMLYMDYKNEVKTSGLLDNIIHMSKTAVLPYTTSDLKIIPLILSAKEHLSVDKKGIQSPDIKLCLEADPHDIDLVIVPGVAFDKSCNRTGYGAGCYDGFLPKLRKDAIKIGIAFDCQIAEALPEEHWDIKMDIVITESAFYQV